MPVTWVAWAMVPSTPARIWYFCRQVLVACSVRAAVMAWWISRGRKPSVRPSRAAVVHWARAGQGWQGAAGRAGGGGQVARANLATIVAAPCLSRAGVQDLETAPCGQVTCWFSQS